MVDRILAAVIAFVSDHAGWAYFTVFLAALLEAVPVVGSFVPGTSIIVGISALVASGRLDVAAILVAAAAGGALGDGTAFLAGHRLKRHLLQSWPLSAYPNVVAQSETFFRRRGTLAVFFGRFVAPVRAFIPVVAGAMDMAPRRFFAVNIPAVLLWAAAHVLISAFAGLALEETAFGPWKRRFEPYAIAIVAIITVTAFALWAIKHWRLSAPQFIQAIQLRQGEHNEAAKDQPRATDLR